MGNATCIARYRSDCIEPLHPSSPMHTCKHVCQVNYVQPCTNWEVRLISPTLLKHVCFLQLRCPEQHNAAQHAQVRQLRWQSAPRGECMEKIAAIEHGQGTQHADPTMPVLLETEPHCTLSVPWDPCGHNTRDQQAVLPQPSTSDPTLHFMHARTERTSVRLYGAQIPFHPNGHCC